MTEARVLHVFKYFRPQFTGEGVFFERLAPIFAALRPDVRHDVLVTETRPDGRDASGDLTEVRYLADGGARPRGLVGWLATEGRRYQVVHFHTHVDRTFLGSLSLKLGGVRLLLSATLDDSLVGLLKTYRPLNRPLVRGLAQLIDQFVAISPKLLDENRRIVPARKTSLVPIGIPIPKPTGRRAQTRAALGTPQDAKVLVCVGGLCERKDQLFLVRQLPSLLARNPDVVLVLVGPVVEVDYRARLDREIAALGLERHVRLPGYAAEPWLYYEAADIFVLASRNEGFGTVAIEAMAQGLPVVVRRLPGVNDAFIEHGDTGYLFDDADDYVDLVDLLLADPARRRAVGTRAKASVEASFTLEAIAARYLYLYGYPAREAA